MRDTIIVGVASFAATFLVAAAATVILLRRRPRRRSTAGTGWTAVPGLLGELIAERIPPALAAVLLLGAGAVVSVRNTKLIVLAALTGLVVLAFDRRTRRSLRAGGLPGVRDAVVARLPSYGAYVLLMLVGLALTLLLFLPMGLALRLSPVTSLDQTVHEWIAAGQVDWWRDLQLQLTKIGNWDTMDVLAPIAVVALTLWYRGERFVPLVAIGTLLEFERWTQKVLDVTTTRPVLPGIGPFPSGGTARAVCFYGLVLVLILHRWRSAPRWFVVAGWATVAMFGTIEGYSRLYLGRHWFTDVPAGYLFGWTMLAVIAAAAATAVFDRDHRTAADRDHPASPTGVAAPAPATEGVRA